MSNPIDDAVDFAKSRQVDGRYVVSFRLHQEHYVHGPFYNEMRALIYLETMRHEFFAEYPESTPQDADFHLVALEQPCLLEQ